MPRSDPQQPRASPAQEAVPSTYQPAAPAASAAKVPPATVERLRLLESAVVHANDAILITEYLPLDLPGPQIVYCNAAFTRMTGYTEAEMLGLSPRILQSPSVDRAVLDRLRGALEASEAVEAELLNCRKNGEEFWVELSIVPVADEQGRHTHWVSVQRDVSHRKIAEEAEIQARIAVVEKRALEAEIRERKQSEERLRHAAFHDDLTKLRNRAFFMDRLAGVLDRAGRQCAVLFLDLDRFKLVNDSLGHRAGDLLLIDVAHRLHGCLQADDTLARVGGDEFAILIEGAQSGAGVAMAERIIDVLRPPFALGPEQVFCSCSIGVVEAAGAYTAPEDLLRDADIAMYEAKKRGAGNHALYDQSMHAHAVQTLALQTDLRHAVARGEFRLFYQPIFSLSDNHLTGLEALIRWQHPQRGLVPPAVFIPIAEEMALIRDIGRWVLREAVGQMCAWQRQGLGSGVRVSINVSANELLDQHFITDLQGMIEASGFDPRLLQLEITEGVFLRHPEVVGELLDHIRSLGVRIALDDFGTGYSSLYYLDRYQFDTIKIDRSFVARMLGQRRAMAILDSIIQLGTALQLDIVAEGIETEAQLDRLRAMRCGHVQGYLLGRPLPTHDFTARLLGGAFRPS